MQITHQRLFLCFSHTDRHKIVQPLFYQLQNYGIDIWYDDKDTLMGDNLYDSNFNDGVLKSRYAVIVISPNFLKGDISHKELSLIYSEYLRKNITVFPIFYDINHKLIPDKYQWMCELKFKNVNENKDIYLVAQQVSIRILVDIIEDNKIKNIEYYTYYSDGMLDRFISKSLEVYYLIDSTNINSKISILYSLYIYILSFMSRDIFPKIVLNPIEYIFGYTKFNMIESRRELLLLEKSISIMIHIYNTKFNKQ